MDLSSWVNGQRGRSNQLALAVGVKASVVSDWAHGRLAVPPARAVAIERATQGQVARPELRADWAEIWPELAGARADCARCAPANAAREGA